MSSNSSRTRTIVKYSLAAVTFAAVSLIGFNFYLQVCGPFLSPLLVTPDQSFLVLAQTTRPRGDGDSSSSSRNSNGGERKREVTGKGDQRKRSRKVTITADSFMAKAPVPPQVDRNHSSFSGKTMTSTCWQRSLQTTKKRRSWKCSPRRALTPM